MMVDRNRIVIHAGMSRSGTTFLYHNLQKHPHIYVPQRKELAYFAYNFDNGLEWYLNFFTDMRDNQMAIDICGNYFMDPRAIDRILDFNPDSKIILGIRKPTEWIFSLYEQYDGNFVVPPFQEFLNGCTVEREGKQVIFNFDDGKIRNTISRFRDEFGSNLFLYDFSILGTHSLALLQALERFIGVPPYFEEGNYTNKKINARGRRRIEWFDRLLQKRGVVDALIKTMPAPVLRVVRNWFDYLGSTQTSTAPKPPTEDKYSERDYQRVAEMFHSDDRYVDELFQNSPVILGDGRPVPLA
ncbi:MAG: hypothetical protein D6675_13850 [Gemmatimonadetes bacterium]|nr:MAG: hypothetical protein D6675_13850 [Gemmatimonadota bacterium]